MRVRIVYRNYKNLHAIHKSIVDFPPSGVFYDIPEVKRNISHFYFLYGKIKTIPLIKKLLDKIIKKTFDTNNYGDCDIIHFVQYVPDKIPTKPYVVDFEHVAGLTAFADTWEVSEMHIKDFLNNELCVGILPMSEAALKTFRDKFGKDFYSEVKDKIHIIYPALNTKANFGKQDKSIINDSKKFNILFVGNHVYRKGLHILLKAFVSLPKSEYNLYVVSDIPRELKNQYLNDNIFYLSPNFSREDIISKIFMPADLFVMPTLFDTFGMVFLDALITETPVLATKIFAIPEIVEHGKDGLLIDLEEDYMESDPYLTVQTKNRFKDFDREMVEKVYKGISSLKKSKEIKKKKINSSRYFLGKNGKFSTKRRNIILKKIYEKALEVS